MTFQVTHCAVILTTLATPVFAESVDWTAGPFDMPESAIFDEDREQLILSVMGGHPGAADGNGSLALLSVEGAVLDAEWVTGLDAPKGMAILGDTLFVADLTRLHEIDLDTGRLIKSHAVEGAVFLNDVTGDTEQAFISDLMTHQIWRYADGHMTLWLEDEALAHPNGLLLDNDRLVVGSWGQGMRDDFTTEVPGALLSVRLADQKITTIVPALGNLDGVVRMGDVLLVNDWITGDVFEVAADQSVSVMARYPAGLADIAAHGEVLFLPSMLEGTLSARRVK